MRFRHFSLPTAGLVAGAVIVAGAAVPLPALAASSVLLTGIQYNPAGTDTRTNAHLNLEYVSIRNNSTRTVNISGWQIRDVANHTFRFPAGFTVKGRTTVVIHTGRGTSTSIHRYWGSGNYIWNNTGDTARLMTASRVVVDVCTYKGVSGQARVAC